MSENIDELEKAVVFDSGSTMFRAGFEGDDKPKVVFPTNVARHILVHATTGHQLLQHEQPASSFFIGFDGDLTAKRLSVTYPIENGVIYNLEDMKSVWCHAYMKLGAEPQERPILLTETPIPPKGNRELLTYVMFESFKVPAMCLVNDAVLALFAEGKSTGLVVSCGHGGTFVVPVYEGYSIKHATLRSEIGGLYLTEFLSEKLKCLGYSSYSPYEKRGVQLQKEQCCYVAADFDEEVVKSDYFRLPNHGDMEIKDKEILCCPELLFTPQTGVGIHQLVYDSIRKCDPDIQPALFSNILLTGGTSLFPGMRERLLKEVEKLTKNSSTMRVQPNVCVYRSQEGRNSAWIGGSLVASCWPSEWITSMEYDEYGPTICHRKCIH